MPDKENFNAVMEEQMEKQYTVRILTPLECERLQGFPDNWSRIGQPVLEDVTEYEIETDENGDVISKVKVGSHKKANARKCRTVQDINCKATALHFLFGLCFCGTYRQPTEETTSLRWRVCLTGRAASRFCGNTSTGTVLRCGQARSNLTRSRLQKSISRNKTIFGEKGGM